MTRRLLLHAGVLVCLASTLTACVGGNTRQINFHLVLPVGYMGFVFVRFDCPGGPPLTFRSADATIIVDADGVACVGSTLPAGTIIGKVGARDTAGAIIPVVPGENAPRPPGEVSTYALVEIGAGEVTPVGTPHYSYWDGWAGATRDYDPYARTDAFERDRLAFLAAQVTPRRATPIAGSP